MILNALAALLPVVIFLALLYMMDSFKLVPMRAIAVFIAGGAAAALVSLWLYRVCLSPGPISPVVVSRYVAPLIEEALKGGLIVFLILRGRAGFLVDAAVQAFAIGAGFALVENTTYLHDLQHATRLLWVVRGLGTAILHGATTAIFATIARALIDRHPRHPALVFVPGFAAAVAIHSAFNHLLLPPAPMTALMFVVLPLLFLLVFNRSERSTREWMGAGMDLDIEVLQLVASEAFKVTRFGQYLRELQARFPGVIVANMYCLLRLELELSVQARAMIMARDAGLDLAGDDDLEAAIAERNYLQSSIGHTGLLALRPLQVTGRRDRWHRSILAQARRRRPPVGGRLPRS